MVTIELPTLTTIVATALIDSINPCAIGVLVLLMSTLLVAKKKDRMMKIGLMYIAAVFLTYFSFGLGLTAFMANIPLWVAEYISIFVGIIVVLAGIIEIKDFFWYGKGYQLGIPPRISKHLPDLAKNTSFFGVFILGAFVAAVELPCTGAPYLAIITILSQYFDWYAVLLLILYNIIFVSPLIIILFIVAAGAWKIDNVKSWKNANRRYMRLALGILMVLLSWLLVLISNGTFNLG